MQPVGSKDVTLPRLDIFILVKNSTILEVSSAEAMSAEILQLK